MKHKFTVLWLLILLYGSSYGFLMEPDLSEKRPFNRVGTHLIVELMECTFLYADLDYQMFLWYAAYLSGSEILKVETHVFKPQGWTGFALLAESHISVHTWPENGYVALDIFMCGDGDINKTLVFFINLFKPERMHCITLERGYELGE